RFTHRHHWKPSCLHSTVHWCLLSYYRNGTLQFLGEDAPLAEAFKSKGLKFVSILISVGAVAGLTTTLLVGLYVQSRLYLGLGRDGLLPAIFARVHPTRHTPIQSQIKNCNS
nr:cationic amino acid transporter 9, chloroplastic [Tanacetum cinerariifolium]